MSSMKICPFCGNKPTLLRSSWGYKVRCNKCYASFAIIFTSSEEAIAAWNKRVRKWKK